MFEAKDQGHKCKCYQKQDLQNFFQAISKRKRSCKIFFEAICKISTIQKKCCPRAEDRPIFEDLRHGGQDQRLDLRGQGLQNVSSRPRTSSRTPPLSLTLTISPLHDFEDSSIIQLYLFCHNYIYLLCS